MPESNITHVKQWYRDLEARDLDKVVGIFSDDAILVYGAGESAVAVPYAKKVRGIGEIRGFYERRFAKGPDFAAIRPFCGIRKDIRELGRWVIVIGNIADRNEDGTIGYAGRFLQIWSFDPKTRRATSTSVYFDVNAATDAPDIVMIGDLRDD
ncbi:MAG: hypothetical protein JWQ55_2478 [Rhodopila sp.]|jgi:hypothetical protein|nr:hypothetical protein [Rhodopila sp.]